MTDTEAALLRAIAAHPDEDTPRLVYADYLDELDAPAAAARAKFIRLHVQAARMGASDPAREDVARRIDLLLYAWDSTWRYEMPPGFKPLSGYRRGFPYRAAARASALLAAADDPRLPPLEVLTLTIDVPTARLHDLVRVPIVAGLKELVVGAEVPIGWPGARALAGGMFPRLEKLDLARQGIGDVGVRALCESWGFPRLCELDLSDNDVTDAGGEVLLDSGLFRRLRHLDVWSRDLSPEMGTRLQKWG